MVPVNCIIYSMRQLKYTLSMYTYWDSEEQEMNQENLLVTYWNSRSGGDVLVISILVIYTYIHFYITCLLPVCFLKYTNLATHCCMHYSTFTLRVTSAPAENLARTGSYYDKRTSNGGSSAHACPWVWKVRVYSCSLRSEKWTWLPLSVHLLICYCQSGRRSAWQKSGAV